MNTLKTFIATLCNNNSNQCTKIDSVFNISINSLNGEPIDLNKFKGKYILLVNVASKCGFTPQYKDLQVLYNLYKGTLEVICVPCNQFGGQEPGNASEIKTFCQTNYGVDFAITEKVDVKGKNKHPLYAWLTEKTNNGVKTSSVKWNFQKYLVDPKGHLVDYFLSTTSPMNSKITKHLK